MTFQLERSVLQSQYQAAQNAWTGAIAGMLVCIAIPTVLSQVLPKTAKTLFLASAVASAGASAHFAKGLNSSTRRHHKAMEKAADQVVERRILAEVKKNEAIDLMAETSELEALLEMMPPQTAAIWRYNLIQEGYLIPDPVITVPAQTVPMGASVPSRAQMAPVQQQGAIAYAPVQHRQPSMDWEQDLEAQAAQGAIAALPPYRDLAKDISDYERHIAFACKTQSGKTTTMIQAILLDLAAGRQVFIIDGKGDKRLKRIPGVSYVLANAPGKMDRAIALIEWVLSQIEDRYNNEYTEPGIRLYIDENNNLLRFAQMAGIVGRDGIKRDHKWWGINTELLVTQGASANVLMRAFAHTSRCEQWGWNTAMMDNVAFCALARCGEYDSIDDLIKFQIPAELKPEYQQMMAALRPVSLQEPVVLAMLRPFGFYRVPKYDVPDFGDRTEEWEPVNNAAPIKEDGFVDAETAYQKLKDLQQQKLERTGQDLTDAELQGYFEQPTGVKVEGQALNYLWAIVNAEEDDEETPEATV